MDRDTLVEGMGGGFPTWELHHQDDGKEVGEQVPTLFLQQHGLKNAALCH